MLGQRQVIRDQVQEEHVVSCEYPHMSWRAFVYNLVGQCLTTFCFPFDVNVVDACCVFIDFDVNAFVAHGVMFWVLCEACQNSFTSLNACLMCSWRVRGRG